MMFRRLTRMLLMASGCMCLATAQQQPAYVRDLCIKVAPGKNAEFGAFLREAVAKRMQVRVDEGRAAWWLALSSVVPAGTAAVCDYHLVGGYNGFPPETATPEQDAAEMKKAGVNMTLPAYEAKRDSLSSLVNVDIWRVRADAGPKVERASMRGSPTTTSSLGINRSSFSLRPLNGSLSWSR